MTFLNGRQILDNSIALIKIIASGTRDATTFLRGDGVFAVPPGGGGSFSLTEIEVDFGTIPVNTKKFTITNASINTNSKIIISTSGNTASDRVGNDWEFDSCNFSATAGTGNFTLSVVSNGHLRGKRKLFYSFS